MSQQDELNQQRALLRKQLRCKRNSLSPQQQHAAAQSLYRQLAQQQVFRRAQHVAFYLACDGEISPHLLLKAALNQGKQVYLPVIAPWPKYKMVFQQLLPDELWETNSYGITQPRWNPQRQRPIWTLDLLCMPLVGFDQAGNRLGMGGGYYDRALAPLVEHEHIKMPTLLGLAHACQEVEQIPTQSWDIPLQAVVTDSAYLLLL